MEFLFLFLLQLHYGKSLKMYEITCANKQTQWPDGLSMLDSRQHTLVLLLAATPFIIYSPFSPPAGSTMGCVRSKEDKSSPLKYRPEDGNAMSANPHLGHYGPDPTGMAHSPAMKTHNNSYNSHTAALTPFGGASSVMTPFGGASTSFTSVAVSSPFPSVITGQCAKLWGRIKVPPTLDCSELKY